MDTDEKEVAVQAGTVITGVATILYSALTGVAQGVSAKQNIPISPDLVGMIFSNAPGVLSGAIPGLGLGMAYTIKKDYEKGKDRKWSPLEKVAGVGVGVAACYIVNRLAFGITYQLS